MATKLWRTIKKCFAKVRKFFKKGNAKVSAAINPKEVDELKTALLEVAPKVVTRSVPFSTAQLNVTRCVPLSTAQLSVTRSKAFSTAQLNVTRSLPFSTATLNATRSLPLSTATLNVSRSLPLSTATETSALELMTQTPELASLNVPSCTETSQLATLEAACTTNLPSSPPAMQSRMRKIRKNRRMTLAIQPDLSMLLCNE